jgi:tubulin polyglutamylase TTLL2
MAQHGVPEAAAKPLVFKCSETRVPPVMRRVLLQKGWREWNQDTDDDTTWSLHWKSGRFKLSDWDNCLPHQRLNHCPKSSGITKKDNLHRNIKRLAGSFGKIFDFVPTTFVLPNEYLAFAKAFADGQDREEEQFWICKPSDSSRGRGIFIISHISQVAILL